MDIFILNFILIFLLMWNLSIILSCCIALKNIEKRVCPLWVSISFLSVIAVILQPALLNIFPQLKVLSSSPVLMMDVFMSVYDSSLGDAGNYRVIFLNIIAYSVIGIYFGVVFQNLSAKIVREPSHGIKVICFTLGFIPLLNIVSLIIFSLHTQGTQIILKAVLPNLGVRVFQSFQYAREGMYFSEEEVFMLGWPTLMESIIFLWLITSVLFMRKGALKILMLLTVAMLVDVLSTLFLFQIPNVYYLVRNISHLVYFTVILLFFTHPNVRDQFTDPKPALQQKPKYARPSAV